MNHNIYSMFLSHLGLGNSVASMKKASFEVKLKGKKQIAEETFEFVFEKPKNFHFNAGQHVRMTLFNPSETDSKGNSRFLTLANTPKEKDLVVAMRMTDSAFKKNLGNMQNGEEVLIQILLHSPHGSFVLHDNPSIPAVFLIGGIGIIPAYSMIKDAIERKLPHKIYLFYSNRRPEDAPYLKELGNLSKQNPNFKFIATMTEMEKSKKSWHAETGIINQQMLEKYLDDFKSPIYYIAGLSKMVKGMKALVKSIGVSEDHTRSEDFSNLKMGIMNLANNPHGNKNHLVFVSFALLILLISFVHIGAAISMFNANVFKNLSVFTVIFIFVIIIFKLFVITHLWGLKHR